MPTTPRTGLRYPDTNDAPNGPLQIGNLAADLDDRVSPTPRPYIDCYLRRSDGSNVINASTAANAAYGAGYTDLKVYPMSGKIAGTWDTAYLGFGLANTTPGWYSVYGKLADSTTGARYILLETRGTEPSTIGTDTASTGYGVATGTIPVRAPTGLQLVFVAYNSVNATVNLRTQGGEGGTGGTPISWVRVVYDGPL
jgi:hypothetical protein